jgi:hypothetical protein
MESPPDAAAEIRAALAWTRRAADREHDFAETLVCRMPAVFTALDTGRLCRSKAWVFAERAYRCGDTVNDGRPVRAVGTPCPVLVTDARLGGERAGMVELLSAVFASCFLSRCI